MGKEFLEENIAFFVKRLDVRKGAASVSLLHIFYIFFLPHALVPHAPPSPCFFFSTMPGSKSHSDSGFLQIL